MKNIKDYLNLHSISNIYFQNISRRMEKSLEEYRKNEVKGFGNFNERYSSAIDEGLEKVLAGKDENTFNGFAGNVLFSYNSGTGQLGFFVTESCLYSEEDIKANRAAAYVLDEIFRKTTALLEEDDDKTDKNIESICNSATKMPLVYMNTAVLDTENRTEKCYILQKKKVESCVPDDIHVSKDIKTIKEYNRRLMDEGQENERVAFEDAKNRGAAIFETFDEVFSLRYPKKNNADGQAVAKAKIRPMPDKSEKQRTEKDDSMELLKYVSKKIFRIESSSDFLHAKRFSKKCEDARNFLALDDRNLWKSLSEDFRQATADMDKETLFALRHISGPVDKNQNMKIWTNNQRNTPTSKQGLVIGDIDLLSVRFDDGMIHIALHEAKSGNKVLSRSQAEIFRLIRNFLSIGESLNVTVCGVKFSLEDNERFSLHKEEDEISGEKALRNSCRGINIFTSKREFRKDNETARPVTTASKRCKNFCCLSGFGGAASPKGMDTFAAMLAEYPSTAKNLLNLAESSYSFFTGLFGTEKTRNGAGKDESGKKAKKEVIVKEKEIEEFVFDR